MHGLLQGKCKIQHSGTQLIRTPNGHIRITWVLDTKTKAHDLKQTKQCLTS